MSNPKGNKYNLSAARGDKHFQNMKELQESGICFMCPEHLRDYSNNRIEFETEHWIITPNAYPYKNTILHLLLIPKRHVKTMSDLSAKERLNFSEAIIEVEKRHKLDSYSLGMRNGDFRYNGGSVEHLHAHIIVGERDPKKFEKVRFKVSSLPES